jgi:hypothetical protein
MMDASDGGAMKHFLLLDGLAHRIFVENTGVFVTNTALSHAIALPDHKRSVGR